MPELNRFDRFDRFDHDLVVSAGGGYIDQMMSAMQPNMLAPMGGPGAGLGVCPELPAGFSSLAGTHLLGSDNFGNYKFSDGSYVCYSPIGYYRWGHVDNPTYATYGANSVHIVGADVFSSEAEANAAGYALHREFKDGGQVLRGVFHHKYKGSPNTAGDGIISVPNGVPVSLTNDANYTNSSTLGLNGWLGDAVDLGRNIGTGWSCMALWDYSWLAMISIAHGQAATSATHCAWYDPTLTTNYPKGCNNNALGDIDDGTILYTTAGDAGNANKPLTGSANHPAKVSHNGQLCGVMDLNGGMFEVALGVTSVEGAPSTNAYLLKELVALADLTSGSNNGDTGSMDAWGDVAHLATLYDAKTDFFPWGSSTNFYRFGNGAEQVFSAALSGDDYARDYCGIGVETGMSAGGTNLFGQDGCYRNNRVHLCPLACGYWYGNTYNGVSARNWIYNRNNRYHYVSSRARLAFA